MNGYSLKRVLPKLPPTALINAAEDIDLDAEPEEGASGELAEAMDRLWEAERKAARSQKANQGAKEIVDRIKADLKDLLHRETQNSDIVENLQERLSKAEQHAEATFRKAVKDRAKAEDSAKVVRQLGGPTADDANARINSNIVDNK